MPKFQGISPQHMALYGTVPPYYNDYIIDPYVLVYHITML